VTDAKLENHQTSGFLMNQEVALWRVNIREFINDLFYVLKTGCSWEMMPKD
jgi:transposase